MLHPAGTAPARPTTPAAAVTSHRYGDVAAASDDVCTEASAHRCGVVLSADGAYSSRTPAATEPGRNTRRDTHALPFTGHRGTRSPWLRTALHPAALPPPASLSPRLEVRTGSHWLPREFPRPPRAFLDLPWEFLGSPLGVSRVPWSFPRRQAPHRPRMHTPACGQCRY